MARSYLITRPTRCGVCGRSVVLLEGELSHALVEATEDDQLPLSVPHRCPETSLRRWRLYARLGGLARAILASKDQSNEHT